MLAPYFMPPDCRAILESISGLYIVLEPDAPRFTIAAVRDAYARQALSQREAIVGKGMFEVFPDNLDAPDATALRNCAASFGRVIATRAPDAMAVYGRQCRWLPHAGLCPRGRDHLIR